MPTDYSTVLSSRQVEEQLKAVDMEQSSFAESLSQGMLKLKTLAKYTFILRTRNLQYLLPRCNSNLMGNI